MNRRIAILGSSSHIAKGLIDRLLPETELTLFGRSAGRIRDFLGKRGATVHEGYGEFLSNRYDVIINCIGAGTPDKLGGDYSRWFTLTETFDNLVLEHLRTVNPEALYINFSSGAVYGPGGCAEEGTLFPVAVNHIPVSDYYTIARLNSEAKHRSLAQYRIVDLRIFSYFSCHADPASGYFMTDVLKALLNGEVLHTHAGDMIRDYIDPDDLYALIRICMKQPRINTALDAFSAATAGKFEILERFRQEFGLRWDISGETSSFVSPNGEKNIYCSRYHLAETYGFKPSYTSLAGLLKETRIRLEENTND